MNMYELLEILIHNPDLPVLTLLIFFLIVRVNTIDRKVATICARLDALENFLRTISNDMKNGGNNRSQVKISEHKERQG